MRVLSRALIALVLAAVAAGTPPALAKQPPVDYQEPPPDPPGTGTLDPLSPGQMHGQVPERLEGVGPYQRLPSQDESGFVVVDTRPGPYWKAGLLDPVLTNACRIGDFASVPLNRMVVRFEAADGPGALQVILPDRRHLLVDKRNLARPGETYYFRDAAFPTCQVWVENPVKPLRKLNAGGTSLPPPDPQALAKEKALFKSWEKPQSP
jgi:hypothetical protein